MLTAADFAAAAAIWSPGPQVVPFIKGRTALYTILRAAGIGDGDEVLVPGYTCVVVPAAIQYTGAKPVFYDVDPTTYNGDPELAAQAVTSRTRALLVQHTYGAPAALGDLVDLCRDRDILLVEDCAHAIGAGTPAGAVGTLGDAAFASFQWSKPVTTGLGGVARINDPELSRSLHELVTAEFDEPSLLKSISLATLSECYNRFYQPSLFWAARAAYHWVGRHGLVQGSSSDQELVDPSMPDGYCETFGKLRLGQLRRVMNSLPHVLAHRSSIADIYARWCRDRGIETQTIPAGTRSAHLRFPLLVEDRPTLLSAAQQRRLEIGDWFNAPLHPQEARAEAFGYRRGACPTADALADRVINLPTHEHVKPADAEALLAFLDERLDTIVRDPRAL